MPKSKEMLGGCCVCSDDHGWAENPLVYCDGCNVAVHQACYGIVSVPTGSWYCRKCESTARNVRVKCELCPFKEGALKKTDSNGWAHVVCALYIPEVRFGNVTTMEPIVLSYVPQDRFGKTCYLCTEQGRGSKASSGACMACNKIGCRLLFHVTCAQEHGLLCEETGTYQDNVKYCGYCQNHNSKVKKGGNVKAIPPYKPIETGEHDSSPGKECSAGKKKSYLAVKNSASKKSHSPSPDLSSVYNMDTKEEEDKSGGGGGGLKIGTTSSHNADTGMKADIKNKFTTSNFIETVVTQSEPVFGSDKTDSSPDSKGKKRKSSSAGVKTDGDTGASIPVAGAAAAVVTSSPSSIKTVSVTLSQLKTTIAATASKTTVSVSGAYTSATESKPSRDFFKFGLSLGRTQPGSETVPKRLGKNMSMAGAAPKSNLAVYGTGTKITIAASRDDPKKPKTEGGSMGLPGQSVEGPEPDSNITDTNPSKRPRSSSQDKSKKTKRPQNRRSGAGAVVTPVKDDPDSPPASPDANKNRKKIPIKEEKDVKPLTVSAPHMLGNQLNPTSSMAQTMHDSLHQEVEAHSIYSQEPQTANLVPPPIPRKFRSQNDKTTLSAANSLLSLGNSATSSATPSTSSTPTSTQPAGLEQLLERQWEKGHQFLMDQAQHFDIGSLLTCLHQLKRENTQLEEHVKNLTQRRDHLLAVNARLNVPLVQPQPAAAPPQPIPQQQQHQQESIMEPRTNGGDAHTFPQMHISASPPVRGNSVAYGSANQRRPVVSQYHNYTNQQPLTNTSNNHNMLRRDDQQM